MKNLILSSFILFVLASCTNDAQTCVNICLDEAELCGEKGGINRCEDRCRAVERDICNYADVIACYDDGPLCTGKERCSREREDYKDCADWLVPLGRLFRQIKSNRRACRNAENTIFEDPLCPWSKFFAVYWDELKSNHFVQYRRKRQRGIINSPVPNETAIFTKKSRVLSARTIEFGSKPNRPMDLIRRILPKAPAMVLPVKPRSAFLKNLPITCVPMIPVKMLSNEMNDGFI